MKSRLSELFAQQGITSFGVAAFSDEFVMPQIRSAAKIPERAQSIIVAGIPYFLGWQKADVAKYTQVPDYHVVVKTKLERICQTLRGEFLQDQFVPFCDASPLKEVAIAKQAGLGVVGKNGLLIHPEYGSFLFIGEIVTTCKMEASSPGEGRCAGCGFCERLCPGGALSNGKIDVSRCASHISQKKGELAEWEKEIFLRSGLVFGCDICQNCCPHNRRAKKTQIPEFLSDRLLTVGEGEIGSIVKKYALGFRGEQVLRRNLALREEGKKTDV